MYRLTVRLPPQHLQTRWTKTGLAGLAWHGSQANIRTVVKEARTETVSSEGFVGILYISFSTCPDHSNGEVGGGGASYELHAKLKTFQENHLGRLACVPLDVSKYRVWCKTRAWKNLQARSRLKLPFMWDLTAVLRANCASTDGHVKDA